MIRSAAPEQKPTKTYFKEATRMDVDLIIYVAGAGLMFCIYLGFLIWAIKSGQFKDNEKVKYMPLEGDEND